MLHLQFLALTALLFLRNSETGLRGTPKTQGRHGDDPLNISSKKPSPHSGKEGSFEQVQVLAFPRRGLRRDGGNLARVSDTSDTWLTVPVPPTLPTGLPCHTQAVERHIRLVENTPGRDHKRSFQHGWMKNLNFSGPVSSNWRKRSVIYSTGSQQAARYISLGEFQQSAIDIW